MSKSKVSDFIDFDSDIDILDVIHLPMDAVLHRIYHLPVTADWKLGGVHSQIFNYQLTIGRTWADHAKPPAEL